MRVPYNQNVIGVHRVLIALYNHPQPKAHILLRPAVSHAGVYAPSVQPLSALANVDALMFVCANVPIRDTVQFSTDKREFIEQLTATPYPNVLRDWLAFHASLHWNRSIENIKGNPWDWHVIRINYAPKEDNVGMRLTVKVKNAKRRRGWEGSRIHRRMYRLYLIDLA